MTHKYRSDSQGGHIVEDNPTMAKSDLSVTVNLDVEPTEKAKEFIRSVVVDVLKEMFADSTWLEERVNEATSKAMIKAIREAGRPIGEIA